VEPTFTSCRAQPNAPDATSVAVANAFDVSNSRPTKSHDDISTPPRSIENVACVGFAPNSVCALAVPVDCSTVPVCRDSDFPNGSANVCVCV
jgi:hypothetical protein